MRIALEIPITQLLAEYRVSCEKYRHNGHLDILRELADGVRGT
jgi:hypothetical protein